MAVGCVSVVPRCYMFDAFRCTRRPPLPPCRRAEGTEVRAPTTEAGAHLRSGAHVLDQSALGLIFRVSSADRRPRVRALRGWGRGGSNPCTENSPHGCDSQPRPQKPETPVQANVDEFGSLPPLHLLRSLSLQPEVKLYFLAPSREEKSPGPEAPSDVRKSRSLESVTQHVNGGVLTREPGRRASYAAPAPRPSL